MIDGYVQCMSPTVRIRVLVNFTNLLGITTLFTVTFDPVKRLFPLLPNPRMGTAYYWSTCVSKRYHKTERPQNAKQAS
jgi:hypothetical protein